MADHDSKANGRSSPFPDEQQPLLSPAESDPLLISDDNHDDDTHPDLVASKNFKRGILLVGALLLFLLEFSQFIMEPAIQEIMEDVICRDRYPDHLLRLPHTPHVNDIRCKDVYVQKKLAMVRSWSTSVELLVPLLVQFPYGMVADKYGRRIVMILSNIGLLLQVAWVMIVLAFPDVFNLWLLLVGSIAYIIGGGGQMLTAIIYTVIADVFPVNERTTVFFQLYAYFLIVSALLNPVGALLLSFDPWLPMWLGFAALSLGVLVSFFWPETIHFHTHADAKRRAKLAAAASANGDALSTGSSSSDEEAEAEYAAKMAQKGPITRALVGARDSLSHVWKFIFASKSIVLLLVAYAFFVPCNLAYKRNLLQYMTKRFNWEWSTATYISTIGSITTTILCLVILPSLSHILSKRYGYAVADRDLLLSRVSLAVCIVGNLLAAIAGTPWLFIASLIIFCLGLGYMSLSRALLNALVEPHTIATLNTTMAVIETVTGALCLPASGWLLGKGIELGGMWMGLPFLASLGCAVVAMCVLLKFRLPPAAVIS